MSGKLATIIISALRRAGTEPTGTPLFARRGARGLFPASALGKHAAESATADGLLEKTGDGDCWRLTSAGRTRLVDQTSPREVMEDCVRAIESRHEQLNSIRAQIAQLDETLAGMKEMVNRAVGPNHAHDDNSVDQTVLSAINEHQSEAADDMPLPDLYRQLDAPSQGLTIGRFHDVLRRLHDAEQLYLHPWTGPLYAMPEPTYALLVGHEIAYYASSRWPIVRTRPRNHEFAQVS